MRVYVISSRSDDEIEPPFVVRDRELAREAWLDTKHYMQDASDPEVADAVARSSEEFDRAEEEGHPLFFTPEGEVTPVARLDFFVWDR